VKEERSWRGGGGGGKREEEVCSSLWVSALWSCLREGFAELLVVAALVSIGLLFIYLYNIFCETHG
jgi:hypothetical protein